MKHYIQSLRYITYPLLITAIDGVGHSEAYDSFYKDGTFSGITMFMLSSFPRTEETSLTFGFLDIFLSGPMLLVHTVLFEDEDSFLIHKIH